MTTEKFDPAFAFVQKNITAFFIWRVENMQLKRLKREDYGKFYTGDSYLIYSAFEADQPIGMDLLPLEPKGKMESYIHFWLGAQTSQDEAGVAAIKAIELDDMLGGYSIQQREMEGFESNRFLSYFSKGFTVLPGGATSGFKTVTNTFQSAMYSVKGKHTPIVHFLPTISWSVMNQGDVYVLDDKEFIFVWIGQKSNGQERIQGAKLAQTLRGQGGRSKKQIVILEDGKESTLADKERNAFNALLPINEKKLEVVVESDDDYERCLMHDVKLYGVSEEGNILKVTEIKHGPLYQKDLHSDYSFIVDNGMRGIYAWIGKDASKVVRYEALRLAHFYAKEKEYGFNTRILRVIDGSEPVEFKSLFRGWKDRYQTEGLGTTVTFGKLATVKKTEFAVRKLYETPKLAAESGMVDDGSGNKMVYRIVNSNLVEVPVKDHGKFYDSDCYVIRYTYKIAQEEHYIIYYWLGTTAGQDEKGLAALKAIELDDSLGGRAVQVRVIQGKEPKHFLSMFKGRMITFVGGKASSFEKKQGIKDKEVGATLLLQVYGNAFHNTKALEVPVQTASLNSNDVFVLVTPKKVFIWCGVGSAGDEREVAKQIAREYPNEFTLFMEGSEVPEFWEALGGKGEYWTNRQAEETVQIIPRLFHCSNATGNLKVHEILDFTQNDLDEDDVMILDAMRMVYVWIGTYSRKDEVSDVEKLVVEYLKLDPKGRDLTIPILKVHQGYEPRSFTGFFGPWNPKMWQNRFNFDQFLAEMKRENPNITIAVTSKGLERSYYPLEVLLEKNPDKLPKDVDVTRKEDFLSDEDFEKRFKMNRQAFKALKPWMQINWKKQVGLF